MMVSTDSMRGLFPIIDSPINIGAVGKLLPHQLKMSLNFFESVYIETTLLKKGQRPFYYHLLDSRCGRLATAAPFQSIWESFAWRRIL
jgi:hypothetical protein